MVEGEAEPNAKPVASCASGSSMFTLIIPPAGDWRPQPASVMKLSILVFVGTQCLNEFCHCTGVDPALSYLRA